MENRLGEKYITKEGYELEIIEYFNAHNCTIKLNNENIFKNIQYVHIKNGNIKNPFNKSVYNVGYIGVGKYKPSNKRIISYVYNVWKNMLQRCYDEKSFIKRPTYKGCSVIPEWHNFQNFAEWFEKNYVKGFHLDKDILVKGNKIYSPTTCCFVPQEINKLFVKSNKLRGDFPIGVTFKQNRFQANLSVNNYKKHIGYFDNSTKAFEAYKITKQSFIKELAIKHREKITQACFQALINYKVEIDD